MLKSFQDYVDAKVFWVFLAHYIQFLGCSCWLLGHCKMVAWVLW